MNGLSCATDGSDSMRKKQSQNDEGTGVTMSDRNRLFGLRGLSIMFSGYLLLASVVGCGGSKEDAAVPLPFPQSRYDQAIHCSTLLKVTITGVEEAADKSRTVELVGALPDLAWVKEQGQAQIDADHPTCPPPS